MKKIFLLFSGHVFLVLGIVGAILPVLPTTPFLLLAVFFYSKSNPKLHSYIINHKYFGPSVKEWNKFGVIRLKAKIIATIMLSLVIFFRVPTLQIAFILKIFIYIILSLVLLFIWTRPSHSPEAKN
jgi:uncharacterized membrane protein YbaN (DUF454 family)